jgi:hypothetical protein
MSLEVTRRTMFDISRSKNPSCHSRRYPSNHLLHEETLLVVARMRRLAQPQVVTSAAIAAALSAILSVPRLVLWENRPFSIWYFEASILFCGFVLWAFVFAWHTEYTHRPVFTLKIKSTVLAAATIAGIVIGLALHFWSDPLIRPAAPKDFPADVKHWAAATVFSLAFTQLFLLYAPFDWAIRLFRNETVALWITVSFGVLVLLLRNNSLPSELSAWLLTALIAFKIAGIFFGVWFYLRGGIFLVWWLEFLLESRHLLTFIGH